MITQKIAQIFIPKGEFASAFSDVAPVPELQEDFVGSSWVFPPSQNCQVSCREPRLSPVIGPALVLLSWVFDWGWESAPSVDVSSAETSTCLVFSLTEEGPGQIRRSLAKYYWETFFGRVPRPDQNLDATAVVNKAGDFGWDKTEDCTDQQCVSSWVQH